jgi:hypothetical protein
MFRTGERQYKGLRDSPVTSPHDLGVCSAAAKGAFSIAKPALIERKELDIIAWLSSQASMPDNFDE